ncbi:hypothetical protein JXA32_16730 [Candidatus Sumerlaeota bacterium]|nr:hypothetical protein [Candidatus Sumerlaeota bacterium]
MNPALTQQLDWVEMFRDAQPPEQPLHPSLPPRTPPAPPDESRAFTTGEIHLILQNATRRSVELKFNRNRSTWMSIVFPGSKRVKISLHEAFRRAPLETLRAVAALIEGENTADRRLVREFIHAESQRCAEAPSRRQPMRPRGRHYDLREVLRSVCAEYFPDERLIGITWGRRRKPGRYVALGLYSYDEQCIRIHPLLDDPRIPEFYLRFVVYHEMLHHLSSEDRTASGRRRHHSPEFRRREAQFKEHAAATAFEPKLHRLMRKIYNWQGQLEPI